MNLSAALHDAKHRSFVFAAGASDSTFPLGDMHVSRFATDEGFVRFNVAAGLLDSAGVERHTDSVI